MTYRIEHAESRSKSFVDYRYRIFEDERLIAYYWHDYRGDEHGIEFLDGTSDDWPVGRMTEFINGGGPQPLVLSNKAVAYLEKMVRKNPTQ